MAYQLFKDEYEISDENARLNIAFVHKYLSEESYWAKNIPYATVECSIQHSLCFGLYLQDQQIGFARLVTDRATFAYLADVFIIEQERGKGLSKWLMQAILKHPDVSGLRRWMLGTRDAHELYRQFGFTPLPVPERFMELHFPQVYRQG
jgi:GNAT superfamily N-acetyltransferase